MNWFRWNEAKRTVASTATRDLELEQDDGENWSQATAQTRGIASRRMKHRLNMGLGRGKIIKEGGLARIEGLTSEHAQLWTYHSWAQWMKGLSWDELKNMTTPGDCI